MGKAIEKFLKKTTDGYVYRHSEVLAERPDMVPCDADGKVLVLADEAKMTDHLDLRGQIMACRKKSEVVDFGARFDVEFATKMKVADMKEALISDLIEKGKIEAEDADADADAKE